MAIITISRELGALGEESAKELARMTGYRTVDRDYLEARLAEHGLKPADQQRYDEKKPGFWSAMSEHWVDYLHFLRLALYEEASTGDCIVMGRGGAFVFRQLPNHLALRFTAPLDLRVARAMRQFSCDERQARHLVEQCDHNRGGFSRINFSIDWADPRGYDLVINTMRLDPVGAAELANSCLGQTVDAADETEGARMAGELLLGQRVLTEIVCVKRLHLPNLTVRAQGGVVTLGGLSNAETSIETALAVAASVPGVVEVKNDLHLMQEYIVSP
jgi:cytidylate kinase